MTLHEWQSFFEDDIRVHNRPGTVRNYSTLVDMLVKFLGKDRFPRHVFCKDVLDFMDTRKEYSRTTQSRERRIGSVFFKFIQDNDGLGRHHNPFNEVKFLFPDRVA